MNEYISAAKFAFLLTVLHNNIVKEHQYFSWKPTEPRCTSTSQKGGVSGWPQAGLGWVADEED